MSVYLQPLSTSVPPVAPPAQGGVQLLRPAIQQVVTEASRQPYFHETGMADFLTLEVLYGHWRPALSAYDGQDLFLAVRDAVRETYDHTPACASQGAHEPHLQFCREFAQKYAEALPAGGRATPFEKREEAEQQAQLWAWAGDARARARGNIETYPVAPLWYFYSQIRQQLLGN
jgi:hypothetical protein